VCVLWVGMGRSVPTASATLQLSCLGDQPGNQAARPDDETPCFQQTHAATAPCAPTRLPPLNQPTSQPLDTCPSASPEFPNNGIKVGPVCRVPRPAGLHQLHILRPAGERPRRQGM